MYRKIVLLILIISLTIPSYAAVSVNDGSAFVTKSDMNSNLNGLRNRVSALENSINVKIDSLVAAYLNRNGIWNGEAQKLNTANTSWKYGYGASTSMTVRQMLATAQSPREVMYQNTMANNAHCLITAYNDGVVNNKTLNLVDTISKTGLAIINTSYTDAVTTDPRVCVTAVDSSRTGLHGDHFLFEYTAKVELFQNSVKLSQVEYVYLAQMAGLSIEIGAIPATVMLMFVQKGSPLVIKYTSELKNNVNTNYACTLAWFTGSQSSTRTWKIDKVTVY